MAVFEKIQADNYEQIVYCHDSRVGLKAIIALHNTALGPATGGCRMWNYRNEEEALTDVLRLSKGMTYKNAISNLKLGGGKAIIIGDASQFPHVDVRIRSQNSVADFLLQTGHEGQRNDERHHADCHAERPVS